MNRAQRRAMKKIKVEKDSIGNLEVEGSMCYVCEDCKTVYAMFIDRNIEDYDKIPKAFPCFKCGGFTFHFKPELDMVFKEPMILRDKGKTYFRKKNKDVIPGVINGRETAG